MKHRRSFLKNFIAAIGTTGLLGGINNVAKAQNAIDAKFLHIVLIWLKDPEKELTSFIKATEEFVQKVAVIQSYHIGTPASTDRAIVDNSYSLCLTVGFDDIDGHNVYQTHPAHKAYVERSKVLWNKVLVYDSSR